MLSIVSILNMFKLLNIKNINSQNFQELYHYNIIMLKRKYLSFLKYYYYYFNKISLCDPDWPTTHSVD